MCIHINTFIHMQIKLYKVAIYSIRKSKIGKGGYTMMW